MRLLLFLFFATLGGLASADGMVFPSETIRTEVKSRIPEQRAVLKFDGREETLLIESTIAGPAGQYGWVVPLPSRPSYVKAVKPEYIEESFRAVRPPVKSLPTENLPMMGVIAVLASALFLTAGLRYRKVDAPWRVLGYCAEGATCFFVASFLLSLGTSQADAGAVTMEKAAGASAMDVAKGLQVESLGTIGAYEVSVLKGETGAPVMDWLKDHGIRVEGKALPVIEAYAKEGWVFLAAEIRKEEDRPLPPHPLKAVFPTTKPVYPMRLTGTQDGPIRLELVIVGDKRAEVPHMEAWNCNNDRLLVYVPRNRTLDKDLYDEWEGDLYAMAKNGSVVTYLRGDIEPAQMQKDFDVSWVPFERYMAEVYDAEEAQGHAAARGLKGVPLIAFFLGFLGVLFPLVAARLVLPALVLALLAGTGYGGGWLLSVKTVDTEDVVVRRGDVIEH